ncbi:hypothetical protein GPALN_014979 [Globodera pallida]|nr:hypothetical protein GPALN_014979 [Globodera pallida]
MSSLTTFRMAMTTAINHFLDYFKKKWIGRQRVNPRFPIAMCNCGQIALDGLPRTSNSAESWSEWISRALVWKRANELSNISWEKYRRQWNQDFNLG